MSFSSDASSPSAAVPFSDDPLRREHITRLITDMPLHRAFELAVISSDMGRSEIRFAINHFTSNFIATLHGGALYTMMDVAAFMALLSVLPEKRHGVTADIQVSVLRPAKVGQLVGVRAWVDRLGRNLANMRAEAHVQESGAEKLIATATVVKALIEAP